jgi:hypothetical protein
MFRERERERGNERKSHENCVFMNGMNVAICCIAMITGESRKEKENYFAENTKILIQFSAFVVSVE